MLYPRSISATTNPRTSTASLANEQSVGESIALHHREDRTSVHLLTRSFKLSHAITSFRRDIAAEELAIKMLGL